MCFRSMHQYAALLSSIGGYRCRNVSTMPELDVPVAGFATDLRTLTIKGPAPALSITPESSASHLRSLETERSGRASIASRASRASRASIDLVQRRRLWWLASVISVVVGATLLCLRVLGGGIVV